MYNNCYYDFSQWFQKDKEVWQKKKQLEKKISIKNAFCLLTGSAVALQSQILIDVQWRQDCKCIISC